MIAILFCSAPVGHGNNDPNVGPATSDCDYKYRGVLNPHPTQPDAYTVTWTPDKPDGQVLSVQPDGSYEVRQAGTCAQYETFAFDESALSLVPNWNWNMNKPIFDAPTGGFVILAKRVPTLGVV